VVSSVSHDAHAPLGSTSCALIQGPVIAHTFIYLQGNLPRGCQLDFALQKLIGIMQRYQSHDDATIDSLLRLKYSQAVMDTEAKIRVSKPKSPPYDSYMQEV
jgi:hypothetical protein